MTIITHPATIPGPPAMPLLGWRGSLLRFLNDPIAYMRMLQRDYGMIARMSQASSLVFVFGPEYNRRILGEPDLFHTQSLNIFPTPEGSAARRLETVLLAMNGPQHRQQRRLMQPAFHRKQIEGYCNDMVAIAEDALAGWQVGQQLDVMHEMRQITLRVASKTLFGRDAGKDAEQIGRMIERWMGMLLSSKIALFPFDLPGTPYRAALRHAERLEAAMHHVIEQKRAHPSEQRDVLAMLLAARDEDGDKLTDIELIGHTNGLFVAGHETTANTLTWTLFLLDQHPHVLRDLRDELHGTLRGNAPTIEQLGQLPLLESVIKETLRLMPPLALSARTVTATCELGPYTLPAGHMVSFSPYITHHMPELYPEPERFRPERWRTITPSPFEYLPFGAGPHVCLGMTFAMTELKIVLALIVQRRRLTLQPGARVDCQVRPTLAPRRGLPMRVAALHAPDTRPEVRGNIHESVNLRG